MQKPAFVTLHGHRIKVQRWQQDAGVLSFTTVIRGEHLGSEVIAATQASNTTLVLDEDTTFSGIAKLLERRVSGAGATAVVRLEIQFTIEAQPGSAVDLTNDQKLDAILAELRALRREVAALKRSRPQAPEGGYAPTRPGTTMLDFEISTDNEPID